MAWKNGPKNFHAMEKLPEKFPFYGKIFGKISIAWKNFQKKFHAMEKFGAASIAWNFLAL